MNPDLVDLARRAQQSDAPHVELSELLRRLRAMDDRGVHEAAVERLLEAAPVLAAAQTWAAEMQSGAEGFDNTQAARVYDQAQDGLRQAGRHLARACLALLGQD